MLSSITPLGAFDTIRDEASLLFGERPDPITTRVSYALTELADRLLHRRADDEVMTREQARRLRTELTGLGSLLAGLTGDPAAEAGPEPGR